MQMKILIADKSAAEREILAALLKTGSYEFEQILFAGSGTEACHIIEEVHPEIVIADACMESMNGLDLLQHCREEHDPVAFIIVSDGADFEKMQTALENAACGYLLRPVRGERLSAAVERAIRQRDAAERLAAALLENEQLRLQNLLMKCKQDIITEQEYDRLLYLLGASRDGGFLGAAVHLSTYRHDRYGSVEDVFDSMNRYLADRVPAAYRMLSYGKAQNGFFLFADPALREKESQIQNIWIELVHKMKDSGAVISVGLSMTENRIDSGLLLSAEKALNQRLERGIGNVYSSHTVRGSEDISKILDIPSFAQRIRGKEGAEAALEFEKLAEQLQPHIYNLEFLFQYLYELLIEMGYGPDKKFWEEYIGNRSWTDRKNLKEIQDSIREELIKACSRINRGSLSLHDRTRLYIDKHFRENLSLGTLAGQFHLNPRYFAAIFKKEEGISPTDYLTKVRIREACRALTATEVPASEIGSAVGYEDPRYFYKVFKKTMGVTPGEYRQNPTEVSAADD